MNLPLKENLISTKEASEFSGYSPDYLGRLVRAEKIKGVKFAHSWLVDKKSLGQFVAKQHTQKANRAVDLSKKRTEEYSLHTTKAKKSNISSPVATLVSPKEFDFTHVPFRTHAFAFSVAFAVLISGGMLARAASVPELGASIGQIALEASSGFQTNIAGVVTHAYERLAFIQNAQDDSQVSAAKRTAMGTSEFASAFLIGLQTQSTQLAIAHVQEIKHPLSVENTSTLSPRAPPTLAQMTNPLLHAYAFLIHPSSWQSAAGSIYLSLGQTVYNGIRGALSAYPHLIAYAGRGTFSLAISTRDSLRHGYPGISEMNLAIGTAIIDTTHRLIEGDVGVSYAVATAAPKTAQTSFAFVTSLGNTVGAGAAHVPALAKNFFLTGTEAPARLAPMLAESSLKAWYAFGEGFNRGSIALTKNYLALVTDAGTAAYQVTSPTTRLVQTSAIALLHTPATFAEKYDGVHGQIASTLGTLTFPHMPGTAALLKNFVPHFSSLHTGSVLGLAAAADASLSSAEQVALTTYSTLHDLFTNTTNALASLFVKNTHIAEVIPAPVATTTPPVKVIAVVTPAAPVSAPASVTVTNYPTYTTVVKGVSQTQLDASLASLRGTLLSTVAGMIQPVAAQTATNITTIQQVNMIQDLSDLIVHNGSFLGGVFDNGTVSHALSVSGTRGSFDELTAGHITLASSTVTGLLSVGGDANIDGILTTGAISSIGNISAPAFIALNANATSTFAGSLNIDNGAFVYATSTRNVGIGVLSPTALLTLQNSVSTQPVFIAKNAAGTELYRIEDNGNVGIGTSTPAYKLDVLGDINIAAGSAYKYNGSNVLTASTTLFNYFFGGAGNLTMAGTNNLASGYQALFSNTTGAYNTAQGGDALYGNTAGSYNSATGYQSLYSNTTGNYNTAMGHSALLSNESGDNNTALGYLAGNYIQDGITANQASSNSLYIGANTNAFADGDTNETVIGYGATGNGSNSVTLGNASVTKTILNGNVGIGTTSPNYALAVVGNGYFSNSLTVGNNLVIQNGSVSIGNATSTLTLAGTIGSSLVPSINATYNLGSPAFYWDKAYIDTLNVNNISAASTTIGGTSNESFAINTDNTTTDTEDMDLIFFRGLVNPNALLSWRSIPDRFEFNQPLYIQNQSSTTTVPTLALRASATQTAPILNLEDWHGNTLVTASVGGSVGIGTASPASKLDVNGDINIAAGSAYKYNGQNILTASTTLFNYFFGTEAGNLTMTGSYNTAQGYQSLSANTTGSSNSAIGYRSLITNTTGSSNVAIGVAALRFNTSGSSNTATGLAAMENNTTGASNTANGYLSLRSNTTGSFNSGLGTNALYSNTIGTNNSAIGYGALYGNTTGSYNSAIGSAAGLYLANGSTANATSNNSLYLGANTKALAAGDTNETVIGYNATGAGSNTVTLGNTSVTKTLLNGNVGIGTTTPNKALTIVGNEEIYAANTHLKFVDTDVTGYSYLERNGARTNFGNNNGVTSAINMVINDAGNVGIGTTGPVYKLDVNGDINVAAGSAYKYNGQNVITVSNNNYFFGGAGNLTMTGNYNTATGYQALNHNTGGDYNVATGYHALFANTTGSYNAAEGYVALQANTTGSYNTAQGYGALYLNTTGIQNTAQGNRALNTNSTGSQNTAIGLSALYYNTTGSNNSALGYIAGSYIADGATANATSNNSLYLGYNTKALADGDTNETVIGYNAIGAGSNTVTLGNTSVTKTLLNGNVGVGTTNPLAKFEVQGSNMRLTSDDGMSVIDMTVYPGEANIYSTYYSGTDIPLYLGTDTNKQALAIEATTGNIGINTTNPGYKLDVNGDINIAAGSAYKLNGSNILSASTTLFNYFFGGAGNLTMTGSNNTAQGYQALTANTTGSYNVANGYDALNNNLTGSYNTAEGVQALFSNTTGSNNAAVGVFAGRYLADGLSDNQTSNNSLYLGYNTKALADGDTNETVIGYNAIGAGSNTVTLGNTSVTKTLLNGSVGIGTATPAAALDVEGTLVLNGNYPIGTENVALGGLALASTSLSGGSNTAIGYAALTNDSSGNSNTAVGHRALITNSTGSSNVALGADALRFNTTGAANTATGLAAMETNTTGSSNTANGFLALRFLTSGSANIGVGYRAGYQTSYGGSNVAIGNDALFSNEGGSFNTAVGAAALNVSQAGGGSNTALGYRAGSKITTGTQNIVVGYGGTTGVTTGSNNTIIGQEVRAGLIATGSNQLNIGNLIFGTGLASSTIFSTGNVGIGASDPNHILTIAATSTSATSSQQLGLRSTRAAIVSGNLLGGISFDSNDTNLTAPGKTVASINVVANETHTVSALGADIVFSSTNAGTTFGELMRIKGTGNVGIGIAAPASKLDVNGDINIAAGSAYKLNGANVIIAPTQYSYFLGAAGNTTMTGIYNTGTGYFALLRNTSGNSNTATGMQSLFFNTTGSTDTATGMEALMNNTTGNGNTATGERSLFANTTGDNNSAHGIYALYSNTTADNNSATGYSALYTNTTGANNTATGYDSLYKNTTGGNNTAAGDSALYYNTTGANNVADGYLAGTYIANGSNANQTSANSLYLGASTKALADGDTNETVIGYNAIGAGSNSVTLGNTSVTKTLLNGSVGIGTTPGYKLDVNGDINVAAGSAYKLNGANVIIASTTLSNYFFGGAGNLTMTGGSNTAEGVNALRSNTVGPLNAAQGASALFSNTTGGRNTGTGYQALFSNTTGSFNSGQGYGALYFNTTGSDNTAVGTNAGRYIADGSTANALSNSSLFVGAYTKALTSGDTNETVIGYNAIGAGSNSVTLGNTSVTKTILNGSVGIGTTPGYKLDVNGDINVAAGSAYKLNGKNIATASTTLSNYFFGGAGNLTMTGSNNIAEGELALTANTTGANNVASGYKSLNGNTTGSYNVATGDNALKSNTTGSFNSAQGAYSLFANTSGSYNSALGYFAGRYIADGSTANATSLNSLYLGASTKALADGDTNETVIGYNAIGAGSNSVTLGNTSVTKTLLNGSVGIGTTPGYKLDVNGDINIAAGSAYKYNGQNVIIASTTRLNYFFGGAGNLTMTGNSNTAVGMQSFFSNTTGTFNAALGMYTLYNNTTGTNNTAQGYSALSSNTIGSNNSALGVHSLDSNTTGSLNSALGVNAGHYIANGSSANATPSNSLYLGASTKALADGDTNETVIGYNAIGAGSNSVTLGNTSVTKTLLNGSVGIGTTPGYKLDVNGDINVAAGSAYKYNGKNIATASTTLSNYFFGEAGNLTMTGSSNTGTGYRALFSNTTASNNTAEGYGALNANTTGYQNTAQGAYALYFNTTGTSNTAQGVYALESNTIGMRNTATGFQALHSNATGSYNSAQGYIALETNTTGSQNTAEGYSALTSNTTGNTNTAVGYQSLNANTTGSNNSALGYLSGQYIANGSTANTISSNSLYLGANTKALADGDTNETVIGYNAIGAGSNTVTLGNTSVTKTILNGSVGIGTTTIASKLTIADTTLSGSGSLAGSALSIDQTWNTTGSPTALKVNVTRTASASTAKLIDLVSNGVSQFSVGGGVTPQFSLLTNTITGALSSGQANVMIGSIGLTNKSSIFEAPNTFRIGWSPTPGSGGTAGTTASDLALSRLSAGVIAVGNGTASDHSGTLIAGNIGIGTTTPAAKLDVWGNLNIATGTIPTLFANTANGRVGIGTSAPEYPLDAVSNKYFQFRATDNDAWLRIRRADTSIADGNIISGIMFTADDATLPDTVGALIQARATVNWTGANIATDLEFYTTAPNSTPVNTLTVRDGNLIQMIPNGGLVTINGSLGVGVSDPKHLVTIAATSTDASSSQQLGLRSLRAAIVSGNLLGGISFDSNDTSLTAPGKTVASINVVANEAHTATALGSDIVFSSTNAATTFGELMRITGAGKVGIGTTTPTHTLEVAGDVGAIAFVNTSTRDAKNNISYVSEDTSDEMLNQLLKLKVATYRYKIEDPSDPLRLGFIAEDAQQIAPEVLSPDGKGVDLYKLATFTLSGVQALASKVNGQDIRLDDIESRLAALENSGSQGTSTPGTFSSSTLASAFSSFSAFIQKGIAQFGTVVANKFVAATDSTGASSAGTAVILSGNTVVEVANTYVTPATKVFVTFNSEIDGSWWVSDKKDGSFRVNLSKPQTSDVSFDYFLVQTKGQIATSTPQGDFGTTGASQSGPDTVAPVITLSGANPLHILVGATFTDPGISVTDAVDGTASYITYINGYEQPVSSSTIVTTEPTTYIITYRATDKAGNNASKTRSVIVGDPDGTVTNPATSTPPVPPPTTTPPVVVTSPPVSTSTPSSDTTAPVVTLKGAATLGLTLGDTFTDPGATATDAVDGDLTSSIVKTGTVDTGTLGSYTLTYKATDASGNKGSVKRTVIVTPAAVLPFTGSSTPQTI